MVFQRVGDRLGDVEVTREVHTHVDPMPANRPAHGHRVCDVGVHEGDVLGHRVAVAGAEVIEHHHPLALRDAPLDEGAADVARAARDEDAQRAPSSTRRRRISNIAGQFLPVRKIRRVSAS